MRLPFPSVDDLPEGSKDIFAKIETSRGKVPDLFRLLAYTPKVLERREAYGKSLRQDTVLDPRLRELAICNVALLNGGGYEFIVHAKMAMQHGCSPKQINDLACFETSPLFNEQERAVMRFGGEVTTTIRVKDSTWAACETFLTRRELVELVLICAWYNQTARITWPLQLHTPISGPQPVLITEIPSESGGGKNGKE